MAAVRDELGWLVALTSKSVQYPKQPAQIIQQQQMRLDRATGGLCLVYVFAAFEEAIDLFRSHAQLLRAIDSVTGSAVLRETILAYRHLRHVVAHGFEGDRSQITTHASEFEVTHKSGRMPNIKWDQATNRVDIHPTAWMEAQGLLEQAVQKIMNSPEARQT